MALTDYMEWLGAIDPNTEEIYAIYTSARDLQSSGGVTVVAVNGGNWMISYPNALDPDLILTPKSKEALLKHIEAHYCKGLDIESWYGMQLQIDKVQDE